MRDTVEIEATDVFDAAICDFIHYLGVCNLTFLT